MGKHQIRMLLISLIILGGLFLRLWHFTDLFYFAIDEEKGTYIIRGITTLSHFPTVGHPSSIGFRLGPGLYYTLAPFFFLFGSTPIVWGYVSVACSLISMLLIYSIGSMISRRAGFYALILYACSYLNILYDRRGWQVSFHSLIALGIVWCLIAIRQKKHRYWYLLTALLIAATHVEVATILFVPLVLIIIPSFRLPVPRKTIAICTSLFLLSQSTLLLFDLRHQFLNTRYLLNYFRPDAAIRIAKNKPLIGDRQVYLAHNLIPATLARTLYNPSSSNSAIQYANCPQYLQTKQSALPWTWKFLILSCLLLFFVLLFEKQSSLTTRQLFLLKTISLYCLILFGGISLYTYRFHGEMAEYYLFSVFAYFFLIVAYLLDRFFPGRWRWLAGIFLFAFMVHNTTKIGTSFNPYGYEDKKQAVAYAVSEVKDKPFVLNSFPTCWYSGGYRYLFTLAGKEPRTSYMDPFMNEYYEIDTQTKPVYTVTILTPELIGSQPTGYDAFRQKTIKEAEAQKKFGDIEVYVSHTE